MSRNDLIAVVRHEHLYYVLANLNADEQWSRTYCIEQIVAGLSHKGYVSRARALIVAHNLQKRFDTEYGVRELY